MASGNIGATTNNPYIVGNLAWSSTSNIEGNYSDVYAELRLWRTNTGYTTWGTGNFSISINGVVTNWSGNVTLTYNSNTLIMTASTRVYHNADGTKSINISASGGISGTGFDTTNCSGTAVLDTIPRASEPSMSTNPTIFGDTVTIYTNRVSTSFTHTIRYGFGTQTGTIATGVTVSYPWVVPTSLASQIPTATTGVGWIGIDTYNGATYIGTKTMYMYLKISDSAVPTLTSTTVQDLSTNVATIVGSGIYVKGLSNLKFTINGATPTVGSYINGWNIKFNGIEHLGSATYTTGILNFSGNNIFYEGKVTDARNRTSGIAGGSLNILPYEAPKITTFTVQRCDSGGTIDPIGEYVKIVRVGTASSLMNTVERNRISCTVQYKLRSSSTWNTLAAATVSESSNLSGAVSSTPIIASGFPISNSYDFRFNLVDKFNTTLSNTVVSTGAVVMSWGQTSVGIGKIWERGTLDVNGSIFCSGIFSNYNNDSTTYMLRDHANGNVTVNATNPTTGILYLGYVNTAKVLMFSDMYNKSGNNMLVDTTNNGFYGTTYNFLTNATTTLKTSTVGGYSDLLHLDTQFGYTLIGSQNATYSHFITDRGAFYFNKPIEAVTSLKVYGTNTSLTGSTLTVNNAGNVGVELRSSNGGTPFIDFSNDNTIDYDARIIYDGARLTMGLATSGNHNVSIDGAIFRPIGDNVMSLGTSSFRWSVVYAGTGTINTSDRNQKTDIVLLDADKSKQFIMGLKPSSFKFIDGTSGRTHYGMISQEVEELMSSLGMTSKDFGGFIKSQKMENVYDDEGNYLDTIPVEGEYDYGLRYDEFIAPVIRLVQEQEKRIVELEKKLNNIIV